MLVYEIHMTTALNEMFNIQNPYRSLILHSLCVEMQYNYQQTN